MANKNRKGFVLIVALLAVVLLLILSGIFVMSSLTEQRVAQRQLAVTKAFYLAEAGIDDAIVNLRNDTNGSYSGTNLTTLGTEGEFESVVTQPDPINQPKLRRIESWGYTPTKNSSAYGYTMKKVEAYVEVTPNPLFPMAIFAQRDITIVGNSLLDSYDSSIGQYNSGSAGSNADIGSNNQDVGNDVIEVKGNSTVKGDATVGPSVPWQDAIDLTGNAEITGTQSNVSQTVELPLVEIPDGVSSSGDLNLSGNTVETKPGGTYWFSSVQLTGNSKLQFTGSATVYVTGDINLAGNGITAAGNIPSNLVIKVVGNRLVKISGNYNFYGGIYAPESEFQFSGNGEIFGAVAADEAKLNGNFKFHYDEALENISGGAGNSVTQEAWHESL